MSGGVVFHGMDDKVGTTMLSQSAAYLLAQMNRRLRVMWVGLNGKPDCGYLGAAPGSVESLRVDLAHRLCASSEILAQSGRIENLSFLPGVTDCRSADDFRPEVAEYLIDCLAEECDVLIVDAGNRQEDGLAIGALRKIPCRIGVLTQNEAALRRQGGLQPLYEQLGIEFSGWLINRYRSNETYDISYIAKRTGKDAAMLAAVAFAETGRRAERDGRVLPLYRERQFCRDMAAVAERLGQPHQAEAGSNRREGRWKRWSDFH